MSKAKPSKATSRTTTTTADEDIRTRHYVTASIPTELFEALRSGARDSHRTVSSQIRFVLAEYYASGS